LGDRGVCQRHQGGEGKAKLSPSQITCLIKGDRGKKGVNGEGVDAGEGWTPVLPKLKLGRKTFAWRWESEGAKSIAGFGANRGEIERGGAKGKRKSEKLTEEVRLVTGARGWEIENADARRIHIHEDIFYKKNEKANQQRA